MFSFFNNLSANYSKLAYDFQFKSIDGVIIQDSNEKSSSLAIKDFANSH